MKVIYSHYEVLQILREHAKLTQPLPATEKGVTRLSMDVEILIDGQRTTADVNACVEIKTVVVDTDR